MLIQTFYKQEFFLTLDLIEDKLFFLFFLKDCEELSALKMTKKIGTKFSLRVGGFSCFTVFQLCMQDLVLIVFAV